MFGMQYDLVHLVNKTKRDFFYYDSIPAYLSLEDRLTREIENLNYILVDNLNFACKFYVNAPLNTFIHTQFTELLLPTSCPASQVKLYGNFSRVNSSLDRWATLGQAAFLKLCSTSPPNTQTSNENSSSQGYLIVFKLFNFKF